MVARIAPDAAGRYGGEVQHVWLIRAGDDAEFLDQMRRAGLIALRDNDGDDEIGDAAVALSQQEEPLAIDAGGATPNPIRAEIRSFVKQVTQGDIVVTPNAKRHEVWLSLVAGDYQFDPDPAIEGYCHTRAVSWLGWLDRDARWMVDQLKALDQPVALIELYNREWWWKQLDSTELTTVARTTWAAPRAAKQRTGRPRASTRAPKVVVPPKPKLAPMRLCSGQCGLQWAPAVLVDGLCPDCRGD